MPGWATDQIQVVAELFESRIRVNPEQSIRDRRISVEFWDSVETVCEENENLYENSSIIILGDIINEAAKTLQKKIPSNALRYLMGESQNR